MQVPCLDCPDRAVGCHGKCKRYKAWQEYKEVERAARREHNEKNTALYEMARKLRLRRRK